MLPASARLRRRPIFPVVYQQGQRFSSAHLNLTCCEMTAGPQVTKLVRKKDIASQSATESQGVPTAQTLALKLSLAPNTPLPSQIAVVVSKKACRRAVDRNRIRRRLQHGLRQQWPHIAPGWWLVLSVRRHSPSPAAASSGHPLLHLSFEDVYQELNQLLARTPCGDRPQP